VITKGNTQAQALIEKAHAALKAGKKRQARKLARQAADLFPEHEQPWLVLAACVSPHESIQFLERALEINPASQKARQGLHWAVRHLRRDSTNEHEASSDSPDDPKKFKYFPLNWEWLLFLSLLAIGCVFSFLFMMPIIQAQASSRAIPRAEGELVKPTLTPTLTSTPTQTPTPAPTQTPFPSPTPDNSFRDYYYHSWDIPEEVAISNDFWVEVNLSQQMLYAYRGDQFISSFYVSTGTSSYPTVTGVYKIYAKFPSTTMVGPGYHLPDVPYSMFFYKGYSLHGTYWHSNFGVPMSHGCVNMDTSDAAWVYEQSVIGTYVFVHY